jgi:hypothetical protein
MTLRRAFWALPLAVTVAVLAHVAVFGFSHAPGAGHAPELLSALGTMLGLGLFGAFLGGALGAARGSITTERRLGYAPLWLAAAAAGAFALIELSEGRLALGPWLEALAAILPLATGVAFAALSADRAARRAGLGFAALARLRPRSARAIFITRSGPVFALAYVAWPGMRRGRAPPFLSR